MKMHSKSAQMRRDEKCGPQTGDSMLAVRVPGSLHLPRVIAPVAGRRRSLIDLPCRPAPDRLPAMPRNASPPRSPEAQATAEIAVSAARLIADEGMDYASAKRRAARDVLGEGAASRGLLPDNDQVEEEVRRHLRLFGGAEHPALLAALRRHALVLMRRLQHFDPRLVGAVLNGTATAFSDLQLHLYSDDVKEVEIHLLNDGVDFGVDEGDAEPGGPLERIHFLTELRLDAGRRHRTGVVLALYPSIAIRQAPRHRSTETGLHPVEASGRANAAQLETLLAAGTGRA